MQKAEEDEAIALQVIDLALALRKRQPMLGCKKIYRLIKPKLTELGIKYGRDKFIETMGRSGLLVRKRKRSKSTTMGWHELGVSLNLLQGRSISRADEVWVSDITYLHTRDGFMYLSIVTDLHSRKILGYNIAEDMLTIRNIESLQMAVRDSKSKQGAEIHHSDRGIQYCSKEYQSILRRYKIQSSMTKGGSPEENAVAERINGILKTEFLISDKKQTQAECAKNVKEAIRIYNTERPHMSLNYQTPAEKYAEK